MSGLGLVNKIKPYENIFGKQGIIYADIEKLVPFKEHPFRVNAAKAEELTASIAAEGVLQPVLLRCGNAPEGHYEIVSGHRRVEAARLLGMKTVPAIIREINDDMAVCVMVDSNMTQRDNILPSERAFAYKMRYEALKRMTDKGASEELAKNQNVSVKNLYRYLRLTYLIKPLLDMVDAQKITFRAVCALSYLTEEQQTRLYRIIIDGKTGINEQQAEKLKELCKNPKYEIETFFVTVTKNSKSVGAVKIKYKKISDFFENGAKEKEIEDTIIKALEFYRQYNKVNANG